MLTWGCVDLSSPCRRQRRRRQVGPPGRTRLSAFHASRTAAAGRSPAPDSPPRRAAARHATPTPRGGRSSTTQCSLSKRQTTSPRHAYERPSRLLPPSALPSPQGLCLTAAPVHRPPARRDSTRLDAATITRREGSAYAKPRAFCALRLSTPRRRLSSALCRLGMSSRCRLLATLTCAAIGASAESVPTIDAHRAGWKGTKAIASPPRGRRGSSMGRPRSNCGAARRRHARILPATAKR